MLDGIDFSKINLSDMMGQIQQIATKVKEDGANQIFTSKVGGGMIELSINGNSEVVDLQIDDSLLEDKDSLQILLMSAMNDVIKQSDEAKKAMAMNIKSTEKYYISKYSNDEIILKKEVKTEYKSDNLLISYTGKSKSTSSWGSK